MIHVQPFFNNFWNNFLSHTHMFLFSLLLSLYCFWEMIFVQFFWQLLDNFLSHTHIIFLLSLFLFLSPLFLTLTNEKREKGGCHKKLLTNGCSNIIAHYFYPIKKEEKWLFVWVYNYHSSQIKRYKRDMKALQNRINHPKRVNRLVTKW